MPRIGRSTATVLQSQPMLMLTQRCRVLAVRKPIQARNDHHAPAYREYRGGHLPVYKSRWDSQRLNAVGVTECGRRPSEVGHQRQSIRYGNASSASCRLCFRSRESPIWSGPKGCDRLIWLVGVRRYALFRQPR
jgi:hypothetical protein